MSERKMAKQLLLSNNYLVLNKTIVEMLGLETAMILSVLADAEDLMSNEDGWFYQTVETLEKYTTLSRYKQDVSLKQLRDLGIVEQKNMGIPMTRHFRIDYKSLTNYFVSHSQTRMRTTYKLECEPLTTNKEHTNKEHNINIYKEEYPFVLKNNKNYFMELEYFNQLETTYPNVDLDIEFKKMQTWLLSNADKRKTDRGMPRFINSWLSRVNDRPKENKVNQEMPIYSKEETMDHDEEAKLRDEIANMLKG